MGEYLLRLSTRLIHGDCNSVVLDWAADLDRRKDRGVVFLDPFKLEVNWTTVEALGRSGVVDLWLWFPLLGGEPVAKTGWLSLWPSR